MQNYYLLMNTLEVSERVLIYCKIS